MLISHNKQEICAKLDENSQELITLMQTQIETLSHENTDLKNQLEWFKNQFMLANQRKYGKSSETAVSINLSFFDEKMPIEDLKDKQELTDTETVTYTRKKKSKGRNFDVSKFPKEQIIHDLDEKDKICSCGEALQKAGEDTSIQVDHIPETFKVIEHVTLKYCCRRCETIKSGKKPLSAIPKCMATAGFIAEVIIKKYEQHLPLHRQSKIFSQLGADIPDNTLGNWVMRAAEVLEPLGQAMRDQIPKVHVLQADETKVQTLKPNKKGYLWGYHGCDPGNRFILFEYSPSRGAHVPNKALKDFAGILQTDGYSGYSDLRASSLVVSVGCWDHCRRKFTDVIKVADNERKGKAAKLVLLIDRLYEIERKASQMSFDERKAHRHEHAKPVLETIKHAVVEINAPPKSLLGVAITYISNQWPYLYEYINYGEVSISNCWIENQIRPFAVGRRNWLFTGTPESANKAALLYSLIQSCKLNNINARAYLKYALNQSHAMRCGDMSPTLLLPQFIDQSSI